MYFQIFISHVNRYEAPCVIEERKLGVRKQEE